MVKRPQWTLFLCVVLFRIRRYDLVVRHNVTMKLPPPISFRTTIRERKIIDAAADALNASRTKLIKTATLDLAREVLALKPA